MNSTKARPLCGVSVLPSGTHWLRSIQAYGPLPGGCFLVWTWWPVSDPRPVVA